MLQCQSPASVLLQCLAALPQSFMVLCMMLTLLQTGAVMLLHSFPHR